MADSTALPRLIDEPTSGTRADAVALSITSRTSHRIAEVEALWRSLQASGIESPGQSYEFTRLWVETQDIAERDQFYIVGEVAGVPVALFALQRKVTRGVRRLSWFPGPHVGCNAPLVDRARLAALTPGQRRTLWKSMLGRLKGIDVVHLRAVPETLVDGVDLFAELGTWMQGDTLYRAQFGSWDEANTTQRSKSRRKHDRQQGEKLEAMGGVSFEEVSDGAEAGQVLDLMFRQRAARFAQMGVRDPFSLASIRSFYDATIAPGSAIDVRLHALRLDGEIVATRYNIAHGDRLFCLISSMSLEPAIQPGSPGKQCLLRVMQSVFDEGFRTFDMGAGFTDEKRHWCNVQIPVRQHYVSLTALGRLASGLHQSWHLHRRRIKDDQRVMGFVKAVRSKLYRAKAGDAKAEADE